LEAALLRPQSPGSGAQPVTDRREDGRLGTIVALGTTQTLAWGSTYYLPAILAAPMAIELGCSETWIFGSFSLAMVLAAFLGPAAGRQIDRHGGRGVLLGSNLLFALGLAALGLASGPWSLATAWLVIGIGMGIGLYEAAFASLTARYGCAARGPITGITLIAGFASTVCWPLSAVMEAEFGWRTACFVWAAAQLVIAMPLNAFALRRPVLERSRVEPTVAAAGASPSPSLRALVALATVFALTWSTSTGRAPHLPRLLQQAGASAPAAIAAAALVGPAQVVARMLEAVLMRRLHPLLSARLAATAHPLAALGLLLFVAPAAIPFAICHGAGNGIVTIAKGTLPLVLFGPVGYGGRQGTLMVPARIAQAAAPLVFGLLLERFGLGALWSTAGLGLLAVLALLRIGRQRSTSGPAMPEREVAATGVGAL
jgi:MFS family permease